MESRQDGQNGILIGAWVAPAPYMKEYNNKDLITDKSYRILKESGINCIYALYEQFPDYEKEAFRALDYCLKYGIRYLVRDKNCQLGKLDLDTEYFQTYIRHPACAGVLYADEPGMENFKEIRVAWQEFRKRTEDKMFYLNLLPVYAQNAQFERGAAAWTSGGERGTKEEYARYIESYLSDVEPEYISYDYYPMEGDYPNIKDDHFWQLSYIRKKTQERKIPFYCFIQCCTWERRTVRNPLENEILWQVSSAILYGCKGIQYFTFLNPYEEALEGAQFFGNLMDNEGNPTEKLNAVKRINAHLTAIGTDVVEAEQMGVMGEGERCGVPREDILKYFPPLVYVAPPCLAGCFRAGEDRLYYVMNPDLTKRARAELRFERQVIMRVVQGDRIFYRNGENFEAELSPGEGVLVKILKNEKEGKA